MPRIVFSALSSASSCVYVSSVATAVPAYQPRHAEQGVLYRVIEEHLEPFLEIAARHADGQRLPPFVEQEFRDFLACGVLTRGFARLRCGTCALERLVPFSRRLCRLLSAQNLGGSPGPLRRLELAAFGFRRHGGKLAHARAG